MKKYNKNFTVTSTGNVVAKFRNGRKVTIGHILGGSFTPVNNVPSYRSGHTRILLRPTITAYQKTVIDMQDHVAAALGL